MAWDCGYLVSCLSAKGIESAPTISPHARIFMNSRERHENRYKRRKLARERKRRETIKQFLNFDENFSITALADGFHKVRKASTWKASTQAYGANLFVNAGRDSIALLDGSWESHGFTEFDIVERGKPRHIRSVKIPEKVIQATFCNECLVPLLSLSLIHDNGASLPGKGTDFSLRRLKYHLRKYIRIHGLMGYIFFFDFSHYFDSIPHDKLIEMVSEKIQDERTKRLYEKIVREVEDGKGLGLGSQVSQISAVFYPNSIDHWVINQHGVVGYGRYMDDGYIICKDLRQLKKISEEFKRKCLSLGIIPNHKKCKIIRLTEPFIYLKTRFFVTETGKIICRVNRDTLKKERRKLRKMKSLMEEGKKPFSAINLEFYAWLSNLRRGKTFTLTINAILYFNQLFKEQGGFCVSSKKHKRFTKRIIRASEEAKNMTQGIVLDTDDVKKIIAEKYGVTQKDVIKSQYSWIIKQPKEEKNGQTED